MTSIRVTLSTGSAPVGLVAQAGLTAGTTFLVQNIGSQAVRLAVSDNVPTHPEELTGWHKLAPFGSPVSALIVEPSSGGEVYVWGAGGVTISEAV